MLPNTEILPKTLRDADLLDAWIHDGRPIALSTLVHRYSVMVLSVCRRRCRCDADAEDAFQSTFLYLARNAAKIRKPECLPGWLHRVAQRSAIATLKDGSNDSDSMDQQPAQTQDPLDRLTQRHEASVLDEELAALPEHYRAALVMHVLEHETIETLATRFGTTTGTIRGRLQRGKRLLAGRLRKRGVVPVFAFAAANTWTVSAQAASLSSAALTADLTAGSLPDQSLLEHLLSKGTQTMTSPLTIAAIVGGAAVTLLLTLPSPLGAGDGNQSQQSLVALPENTVRLSPLGQQTGENDGTPVKAQVAESDFGELAVNYPQNSSPGESKKDSRVVTTAIAELDSEMSLSVDGTLADLPDALSNIKTPILFDTRGLAFAEVDKLTAKLEVSASGQPLRTILRRALRPMGLKANVEAEGIVISADPSVLVHKGIGVSKWVSVNEEFAELVEEKLSEKASFEFHKIPILQVAQEISKQQKLPLDVNMMALEEIGLSPDSPISFQGQDITLRSSLRAIVANLDLVYQLRNESLEITTPDAAESQLLTRIYWLEALGISKGGAADLVGIIEGSIQTDTWASFGGPSTIAKMDTARPAIIVSSTYFVHEEITAMFKALRESHFGPDSVDDPSRQKVSIKGVGQPKKTSSGGLGARGPGRSGLGSPGGTGGGGVF